MKQGRMKVIAVAPTDTEIDTEAAEKLLEASGIPIVARAHSDELAKHVPDWIVSALLKDAVRRTSPTERNGSINKPCHFCHETVIISAILVKTIGAKTKIVCMGCRDRVTAS